MRLDIVIPTYNRAALLRRTLESIARARRPEGLDVRTYVVDNNSPDDTAAMAREFQRGAPWVEYVFEKQQGRSAALNAGIAAGTGELVGMIDDDEEIADDWLVVVARCFAAPGVDFIGGPYRGRYEVERPDWVPDGYGSVIGEVAPSAEERDFGPGFNAILMGGNAVVRRVVLERVGPYNTSLGRTATGLASGEDDEMFTRLLAAGARGKYVPQLVIDHFIPATRLTKRYHRQWAFWHGVSMGELDRTRPEPVPYLLGVPRYRIAAAARGLPRLLGGALVTSNPGEAFRNELQYASVAGFVYGKLRSRGRGER